MTKHPALKIRRARERGHGNHGWLNSWHTFSFADYYDPTQMGFRSLRVINDDTVAPHGGFPEHSHSDMEIFSYILSGSLAHQDSLGNRKTIRPGDIQIMRAGSGVRHSEFNPSATEPVHFLQIWITPHTRGLPPAYHELTPAQTAENDGKTLIISPDGRNASAEIAQDAFVYQIKLRPGQSVEHTLDSGRGLWLQVVQGNTDVSGLELAAGDAASSEEAGIFHISAGDTPVEAILFDLK